MPCLQKSSQRVARDMIAVELGTAKAPAPAQVIAGEGEGVKSTSP